MFGVFHCLVNFDKSFQLLKLIKRRTTLKFTEISNSIVVETPAQLSFILFPVLSRLSRRNALHCGQNFEASNFFA